jgi:NTP pyrophosphatase (non-canonical NTP hydrolase)
VEDVEKVEKCEVQSLLDELEDELWRVFCSLGNIRDTFLGFQDPKDVRRFAEEGLRHLDHAFEVLKKFREKHGLRPYYHLPPVLS